MLESRNRHDTVLVASDDDTTGVPTAQPGSSYSSTRGTAASTPGSGQPPTLPTAASSHSPPDRLVES